VTATLADYRAHRELLTHLTLRELRSKYKRSFFGWAWSLVTPLVNMVVYTIVFSYFLKAQIQPGEPSGLNVFALYLMCGMLPFNYLNASVMGSIGSVIGGSSLIKKTYFPRELLPAATVISNLVTHLIEMGLLLVALLAFGNWRAIPYLPITLILILLTTIFGLGLGLALSVLNVYFRDIQYLMTIVFVVWFFLTPIVYSLASLTHVSGAVKDLLKLNPMTDAVLSFRATLYDGTHPGWLEFSYFAVVAIGCYFIGRAIFNRFEGRLAEEL